MSVLPSHSPIGTVFLEWAWAEEAQSHLPAEKWMTIPSPQRPVMSVRSTVTRNGAENEEAPMKQMPPTSRWVQSGSSWCLLLQKGLPDSCGFLWGCSKVSKGSLGRKSRHSPSSRLHFTRVCGALWTFLLLLGSAIRGFSHTCSFPLSRQKESNTHPKSAERTRSEPGQPVGRIVKWHSASYTGTPSSEARGCSPEKSHVECEGTWILDKNNMELRQPGFLCLRLPQPFSQLRNAQILTQTSGSWP